MISVIIPTKNNLLLLRQCVKSLEFAFIPDGREIIVVDNGSGVSAGWAKRHGCTAYYTDNYTFAQSCNLGVSKAVGDDILLCNDDIVFKPCSWYALRNMSINGCRLTYPNGLIQHGGVGFDMGGNPYHLWHLAPSEHPEAVKSYPVPAVTFALAMIRRDVWDKLGGLDEGFVNSYEDIDFCLRAREAGYMTWYSGENSAIHLTGQTEGRNDHVQESWQHFGEKWLADGRIYRALGMWPIERS